jgi:chromate reductase
MPAMGQPEAFIQIRDGYFDAAGNIVAAENKKFLQGWMDRYVAWVKKHA